MKIFFSSALIRLLLSNSKNVVLRLGSIVKNPYYLRQKNNELWHFKIYEVLAFFFALKVCVSVFIAVFKVFLTLVF